MFWSHPNPWAKSIGGPDGSPRSVTLFLRATSMRAGILSGRARARPRAPAPGDGEAGADRDLQAGFGDAAAADAHAADLRRADAGDRQRAGAREGELEPR